MSVCALTDPGLSFSELTLPRTCDVRLHLVTGPASLSRVVTVGVELVNRPSQNRREGKKNPEYFVGQRFLERR